MEKLIVITGPTASGKTALSIELAERIDGEIISADSMQIYKGMDIGTAKPTIQERRGIPHHMLDVVEPWKSYSVAEFVKDARECIDDCIARGKKPILTGGTGLYIDSIIYNTQFGENTRDEAYRRELEKLAEEKGSLYIHDKLKEIDSKSAERIHHNDIKRVVRALEVYKITGRTITAHNLESRKYKRYDPIIFALNTDRKKLYERIDKRVQEMLDLGLINEVKYLLENGLSENCTAMQGIGYKEVVHFLNGSISENEMLETIQRESRRYAKRQLTWFRKNPEIIWLMLENYYNIISICEKCFTYLQNHGII